MSPPGVMSSQTTSFRPTRMDGLDKTAILVGRGTGCQFFRSLKGQGGVWFLPFSCQPMKLPVQAEIEEGVNPGTFQNPSVDGRK